MIPSPGKHLLARLICLGISLFFLTVIIDVVVARITELIAVHVLLPRVGVRRAVVALIADTVPVAIALPSVGRELTIVLNKFTVLKLIIKNM